MNKKIIFIISIVVIIFIGIGVYFALNQQRLSLLQAVTNFEECAQAGYPVGESHPRQCWTPDGRHFIEDIERIELDPLPIFSQITISGKITCLPKIGTGPQTMECVIGIKGNDGNYYGLKNLFKLDPDYKFSRTGLKVEISGTLLQEEMRGPDGNKYNIVGVIDIVSIKKIENER